MKLFQYLLFYPGTLGIAIVAFLILSSSFFLCCWRADYRDNIALQYNMIIRYSWIMWGVLAYGWIGAVMLSIILIGVFFFPLLTALSLAASLTVGVFLIKSLIDYRKNELSRVIILYLALLTFVPGAVLFSGAWYVEYYSTPGYTKGRNIGKMINYTNSSKPLFSAKNKVQQAPKFFLVVTTQKTPKGESRLFGRLGTMEYIQSLCKKKLNVTVIFHTRPGGGLTREELKKLPAVKAHPTWNWRYNDMPAREFNKLYSYGTILFILDADNIVLYDVHDVMSSSDQSDSIKKELLVKLRKKYPI